MLDKEVITSSQKAFHAPLLKGFSKMSKEEKIDFLIQNQLIDSQSKGILKSFLHNDKTIQKIFDEFSENTISNFYLPFGVCPNVLINNKSYCVPMVIEESSVVAAASKSAKFWYNLGGFHAEVIDSIKIGQVHLIWNGRPETLKSLFDKNQDQLLESIRPLTVNMNKRGGGLRQIKLLEQTFKEAGYFQIWCEFETCDAMGANFINTILETIGREFKEIVDSKSSGNEGNKLEVVMAILSNYTPDCRVRAWVECPIDKLENIDPELSADEFVQKFQRAIRISKIDVHRATTHNKGIFNGIDSVVLATGNDFRAVEACGHTYAARNGQYEGLTDCIVKEGKFSFSLEMPLSLGTVGGLTALHPMSKLGLSLLGNPSSKELMKITAVIGLVQNFGALRSLVTTGIQKGHMKMHLMNILNHFKADLEEIEKVKQYFEDKVVSFKAVSDYLFEMRTYQ